MLFVCDLGDGSRYNPEIWFGWFIRPSNLDLRERRFLGTWWALVAIVVTRYHRFKKKWSSVRRFHTFHLSTTATRAWRHSSLFMEILCLDLSNSFVDSKISTPVLQALELEVIFHGERKLNFLWQFRKFQTFHLNIVANRSLKAFLSPGVQSTLKETNRASYYYAHDMCISLTSKSHDMTLEA